MGVRHFYDLIHQRWLALPTNTHGKAMYDGQRFTVGQLRGWGIVDGGGVRTEGRVPIEKTKLDRRLNSGPAIKNFNRGRNTGSSL